jgi:Na+/Pi-cotransporter
MTCSRFTNALFALFRMSTSRLPKQKPPERIPPLIEHSVKSLASVQSVAMESTTAMRSGEKETGQGNASRRSRRKAAAGPKFGDSHMVFDEASFGEEGYYFERASCQDISKACCVHTRREWIWRTGAVVLLLVCVYFFVVGMDLFGTAAQVMAGCKAGEIFGASSNPLTALMIGVLVTVLLQSSGTTTGIIYVRSPLHPGPNALFLNLSYFFNLLFPFFPTAGVIVALTEANVLTTAEGIYMVMGANIGTTVRSHRSDYTFYTRYRVSIAPCANR